MASPTSKTRAFAATARACSPLGVTSIYALLFRPGYAATDYAPLACRETLRRVDARCGDCRASILSDDDALSLLPASMIYKPPIAAARHLFWRL